MMMFKRFSIVTVSTAAVLSAAFGFADVAPVVDINNSNHMQLAANANQTAQVTDTSNSDDAAVNQTAPAATADDMDDSKPMDWRVKRLSRQMKNLTQMNLPQQISDLQNQIQQLRGQLQVQSHDLQLLNNQQRSFYQDVDQRIQQLKAIVNNSGDSSSSSLANGSSAANTASASSSRAPKASAPKKVSANNAAQDFNIKDAQAYQQAFALVLKKQLPQAKKQFLAYLDSYPNGRYAVNAHYWLGEIYLRQTQAAKALTEFNTVVKNYPKSNKVADSKLKIAMIHMSQGQTATAKAEYLALQKQYPGTTAAQLASIQLQQMAASQDSNHVQQDQL